MTKKKIEHPGWAIKYPNNLQGEWWQPGAHGSGCWYYDNPALSETYGTEDEARRVAESLKVEDGMTAPYIIIEAWEPLAIELHQKVESLEKRCSITQDDLWDVSEALENIKLALKLKDR